MTTTGYDVRRAKDKGMPPAPLLPRPVRARCACTIWLIAPSSVGVRCVGCDVQIRPLPMEAQP